MVPSLHTFLELQPTRKILVIPVKTMNMHAMQSRNATSFRQEQETPRCGLVDDCARIDLTFLLASLLPAHGTGLDVGLLVHGH